MDLAVDRLFFLFDATLDPLDLFAPLCQFSIQLTTEPDRLVFRRDGCVSSFVLGLFADAIRVYLRLADAGLRPFVQIDVGGEDGDANDEQRFQHERNDTVHECRSSCAFPMGGINDLLRCRGRYQPGAGNRIAAGALCSLARVPSRPA